MMTDHDYMQHALHLAKQAEAVGEVPVGAVLVLDDTIIAETYNQPINLHDPCAHAEILALRAGAKALQNYRLLNTTLYVTLEPCAMCAAALIHARVKRVVYAAPDPKSGAVVSCLQLFDAPFINHRVQYESGLLADEARALLQNFFRRRR